jgi:hypothetical protein
MRPDSYYRTSDGLSWDSLLAAVGPQTFDDGPAGLVGFDESGDAWRFESYTDDEAYLLAGLRDDARSSCAPRREGLPDRAIAGVECAPPVAGIDQVGAYRFTSTEDLLATYFERLASAGIRPGSGVCPEEPGEMAYVPEAPGTVGRERIGCFVNEFGNANLRSTAPREALVYIGILGEGPAIEPIWTWAWKGNLDQPGSPTIWREPTGR